MSVPADFVCEYASGPGQQCDACDCFVLMYPESPFALHPEAFIVGGHSRMIDGQHTEDCPGCEKGGADVGLSETTGGSGGSDPYPASRQPPEEREP